MKLKTLAILIFIIILMIPISTFGITEKDNGKIEISPVTKQNFEGLWMKGVDIKGYTTKEKESITSTHNNLGYHIFLNVNGKYGEMNGKYTLGKENMKDMHYKEVQNDTVQNIDGIELLVTTKYLNNGRQVQIIYTIKNTTKDDAKISLGTAADVEIDGDDKATIEKLNNGEIVKLYTEKGKTKNKVQFVLYGRNTEGVTNIDNLWIGNWSDYYLSNIFNNNSNIKKIENKDSALTFSWVNREIKAGETKKYSVIMEVGEQNIPNVKIPIENNTKLYYSNAIIYGTVEDKDLKDMVTIHYLVDNKEYTLPTISTKGKAKEFSLDLTKLNLSSAQSHTLKVWAIDSTNSKSNIEERNFIITYLKNPKIILSEKEWTKNDVTFQIIDTENEKQYVEKYQYRINNKEWIDCKTNTNSTIKENGINQIDVRVVGPKEGDTSDIITEYIKIDKINPSNTTPTAINTTNSITVKCTQMDEESGIDSSKTLYAIKEGNKWSDWQANNTFIKLKPNTKYWIKTKSTDKAGNITESQELEVKTEPAKVEIPKEDSSTNIVDDNNKKEETENKLDKKESVIENKEETIINKETLETKQDNTIAKKPIPKTGENNHIIIAIISLLTLRASIYYLKLQKIKNRI